MTPIKTRISSLFGINRGQFCAEFKTPESRLNQLIAGNSGHERNLLEVMYRQGIYDGEARTFAGVKESDFSIKLSGAKLGEVFLAWGSEAYFNESQSAQTILQYFTGIERKKSIFEGFSNLLWSLAPQNRGERAYAQFALRTSRTLKALYYLSTEYTNHEDVVGTTKRPRVDFYGDGSGSPREVKLLLQKGFLSGRLDKDFFTNMADQMESLVETGMRECVSLSKEEITLYHDIAQLIRDMAGQRRIIDHSEIISLISRFENLPKFEQFSVSRRYRRLQKRYNRVLTELKNVVSATVAVLESKKASEEFAEEDYIKAQEHLLKFTKRSILSIKDLMGEIRLKDKNIALGLRLNAAFWIAFSTFGYISYRTQMMTSSWSTITATVTVFLANLFLMLPEVLLIGMGCWYQGSVFTGAKKVFVEGWQPMTRESLSDEPAHRPSFAYFLTLAGADPSAAEHNIKEHAKACMCYGENSQVFVAALSSMAFHWLAETGYVREGTEICAKYAMVKEILNDVQGLSNLTRNDLASAIVYEHVPVDSLHQRPYVIQRCAGFAREPHRLAEYKIGGIGRYLAARFAEENKENPAGLYQFSMTHEELVDWLIGVDIDPVKADSIAAGMLWDINSLMRWSTIAGFFGLIFRGNGLTEEGNRRLSEAIQNEFGLAPDDAEGVIAKITNAAENIKVCAAEVTGRRDLTPHSRGVRLKKRREAFNLVYEAMAEFAKNARTYSMMPGTLGKRLHHIVQDKMFFQKGVSWQRILARELPLAGTLYGLFKPTKKIADEIARGVNDLYKISGRIEADIEKESVVSYEEAEASAWFERRAEILEVVTQVGARYGLTLQEIDDIANGIIPSIESFYGFKKVAAFELANFMADKLSQNPTASFEDFLKFVFLFPGGDNAGGVNIGLAVILGYGAMDLNIDTSSLLFKNIQAILESTVDPKEERDNLIKALQVNFREAPVAGITGSVTASLPIATEIVDNYIKYHEETIGKMRKAFDLMRDNVPPKIRFSLDSDRVGEEVWI